MSPVLGKVKFESGAAVTPASEGCPGLSLKRLKPG